MVPYGSDCWQKRQRCFGPYALLLYEFKNHEIRNHRSSVDLDLHGTPATGTDGSHSEKERSYDHGPFALKPNHDQSSC
jgi:hypothetical protein